MEKPADVKLLPHLPYDFLAESSRKVRQTARGDEDRIVPLALLEERRRRPQMRADSNHRGVHKYNRVCRISSDTGVTVGAQIDIYA